MPFKQKGQKSIYIIAAYYLQGKPLAMLQIVENQEKMFRHNALL
jgi:hypothetical protein